ncbi:MAG: FixH family protein [Pseudomonadota bacterium]
MKYSKKNCVSLVSLAVAAAMPLATTPTFAAKTAMQMSNAKPMMATAGYSFELAGPPLSAGAGESYITVKLLHDGKPVTGAIVIQSRADMGPIGMAGMTAPIKPLGEQPPGIYRFEVDNGPVWKKPDNWALTFGAKVQGAAQTVTGSVTVQLRP